MIVTTPRRGRSAAARTVATTALALAIMIGPLTAPTARAAICGGGGNCAHRA
jgi:hypothetical protein